jgi:hypothetical protein
LIGCSSSSAGSAPPADAATASDVAEVALLGPPQPACDALASTRQVAVDLENPSETTSLAFDQFTPTMNLSPTVWSFDGHGLRFAPTAPRAEGTAREPSLPGVATFHASVQVGFGTGDASAGLLARADDPTATGAYNRLEIRLDRASGQGVLVVTATADGVADPAPFQQSLGAIDGTTSPYTLAVDTFDPTTIAVSIAELGVAVRVPYPADLPPIAGLYGLIARAGAGDAVTLRAWGICATSF